ncbi:APC family permease [Burkholderia sp. Bp9143]|uniref:APC family permease n=1 Tax=Burkholderia sp. Bp9143 TaxID=2184574 RepID=UPI0026A9016D
MVNLPAFVAMLVLTALLLLGGRESARLNNAMIGLKIGIVLLFILCSAHRVQPVNWHPLTPFGYSGVFSAATLVFFALIGSDAVTSAAEEVKRPARNLPIGIGGSLAVCIVLYVAVSAIMTGIASVSIDPCPLHCNTQVKVAGFGYLGAILGMTTVILVLTYGQRVLSLQCSEKGHLPKRLSRVHSTLGTPFFAT